MIAPMLQTISWICFSFPADKLRYFFLLLVSYPLAVIFRHVLHYAKVSTTVRHIYLGSFGMLFSIICFGSQTVMLLGFALISYALLFFPPRNVHWFTMVLTIVLMSIAHIYRMITDYGGWTLDFTGPFMMMLQRTTYVAFSYHDGKAENKILNKDQEINKIEKLPSFIEYMCYCFNFLSFLTGPSSTFMEYKEMITGQNFNKHGTSEPKVLFATIKNLAVALATLAMFVSFETFYSLKETILDDSIPFYMKIFAISIMAFTVRCRYYFAFYTADSVCIVAGYGFNGYDELGQSKWDLVTSVDFIKVEFASNIRELSIGWNMCTAKWLRRCIYERVPSFLSPTIMTFLVSAVWHGFYPVYYCTFATLALGTVASRKIRVHVRPLFQHSTATKTLYDLITILTTSVYRDFVELVFIFLSFEDSWKFAGYYYYFPYISVALVSLLLPSKRKSASAEVTAVDQKKRD